MSSLLCSEVTKNLVQDYGSLKVLLWAAVVMHRAAAASKLILSLPLAGLLRQSLPCKLHWGLEHRDPEVLNQKVQAEVSDAQTPLLTTFAVEFKDVSRN